MLSRLLSLDEPVVIAHRGGSRLRPENTLAAFQHAVALGVDGVECDVHLSRDGEVVVIHDDTLDRTTDGRGPVEALTMAELGRVNAAARFEAAPGVSYASAPARIPRLADVLDTCRDLPVIVEVKGDRIDTAERALAVIREAGAESRVVLGGFSQRVLAAVRRMAPHVVTSASRVEVQSALRRSWLFLGPRRTGFTVFQIPLRLRGRQVLTRRLVRMARAASIPVQAWIVDEPSDMRMLLDWGVTGFISDRPDVALDVMSGLRRR